VPSGIYERRSAEERFWEKVDKSGSNECWIWTGTCTAGGYGQFHFDGSTQYAHRVSYGLIYKGTVPERLDHRPICPKNCVNPAHLRPVTNKQNMENRPGPPVNNTSGVLGVTWHKQIGRWRVQVGHHGKHYSGGCFPLEKLSEAEAAAIALRNELFTHNDLDRSTRGVSCARR
jgi:hypothetical protein